MADGRPLSAYKTFYYAEIAFEDEGDVLAAGYLWGAQDIYVISQLADRMMMAGVITRYTMKTTRQIKESDFESRFKGPIASGNILYEAMLFREGKSE